MSTPVNCWRCKRAGTEGQKCEGCGYESVSEYEPTAAQKRLQKSSSTNGQNFSPQGLDNLDNKLLTEIARNVEKTKFATRAIYKVLLIQLTSTVGAAGAYVWGSNQVNTAVCLTTGKQCEPNYWLQFLALIFFIVGSWRAQYVANREFDRSE